MKVITKLSVHCACWLLLPLYSFGEQAWWDYYGVSFNHRLEFDGAIEPDVIWDVAWDPNSVLYIGAEQLWRWDGTDLKAIARDTLYHVRSMQFSDDGMIWLVAHGEFGYINPQSLVYESKMDWFPEDYRSIGETWILHKDGGNFWIGTEHRLYRVSASDFQVWEFSGEHRVIFHFLSSGVYAHQAEKGLWRIDDGGMRLINNDPELSKRSVLYLEETSDDRLIAVSGYGLFELFLDKDYSSNTIMQFETLLYLSSVVKDQESLLLGTLGEGIFKLKDYLRTPARPSAYLEANGESVINLKFDQYERLWILDTKGISLDYARFPFKVVDESYNYPSAYITSLEADSNGIGLGTINGYYKYDIASSANEFAIVTQAEIAKSILTPRGRIYNSYDKVFLLAGNEVNPFFDFNKSIRNFAISSDGKLYVSFSDHIEVYRWNEDNTLDKLATQKTPVAQTSLEADGLGNVWGWSAREVLTRYSMSSSGELLVEEISNVAGRELTSMNYRIEVVAEGPLLMTADELIRWLPMEERWEANRHGKPMGLPLAQVIRSGEVGLEGWLVYQDPELNKALMMELDWPNAGQLTLEILPWVDMEGLGRVRQIEFAEDEPDTLVIAGSRGMMLAPLSLSSKIPPPGKPVIWDRERGDVPATMKELPFGELGFNYKFNSPGSKGLYSVRYQTRISGLEEDWTPPALQPYRALGQLMEDQYTLEVRSVDPFGRVSPVAQVGLSVTPPWHRTPYARILGALAVVALFFILMRIRLSYHRRREAGLEAIVKLRTEELARANEVKDDFIANLSHEIRNPLNGVIGLIRLLQPDQPPPKQNLESLRSAAAYLSDTVEDVLDFSRLESGLIELEPAQVDVGELVEGVISAYSGQAKAKGLPIQRRLDLETDERIITDKRKLGQVLGNLISNAIKFTEDGEILVAASIERRGGDNGLLELVVQDSGPGIPPEEQDSVFEKFFQSRGQVQKTKGTGLGLTLVKSFVEAMQGRIDLDSSPGQGTRFTVSIPVQLVNSSGSGHLSSKDNLAPHELRRADKLSVLVIEDMEYNSLIMEELLGRMGLEVEIADDGRKGLELAKKKPFAAIFLDWDLPGVHGLDVARELTEGGHLVEGSVIIGMSAFATPDVRVKCLNAGMSDFITKPIDEEKLKDVVKEWLLDSGDELAGYGTSRQQESSGYQRHLLGEMSATEEAWRANKLRWLGIFEEHVAELDELFEGNDIEAIRRQAHKLLGHLGMVRAGEDLPNALKGIQEAARAGDLGAMRQSWRAFEQALDAFREVMKQL